MAPAGAHAVSGPRATVGRAGRAGRPGSGPARSGRASRRWPVGARPRVVALVDAATVAATAGQLAPGSITVGTRVEIEHLAATPVGRQVVAEARLVAIDGRRLVFTVAMHDGDTLAAQGQVERI